MLEAVMNNYEENEFIVKAAAPADYRVKNFSIHKIKAKELSLELEKRRISQKRSARSKATEN